jgi:hypothetical protein
MRLNSGSPQNVTANEVCYLVIHMIHAAKLLQTGTVLTRLNWRVQIFHVNFFLKFSCKYLITLRHGKPQIVSFDIYIYIYG